MKNSILITVEESDSSVGFFDLESEKEIARIKTGFWPHEIEITPSGKTAYVTNFGIKDYDEFIGEPGASISVIDTASQCEEKRLYTFRNKDEYEQYKAPHGIKLNPQGTKLYVNVEKGKKEMLIFDLTLDDIFPKDKLQLEIDEDDFPDDSFELPIGTHNFEFSADGSHLFVSAGFNGLYKLDSITGKKLKHFSMGPNNAVRGVSWTADEKSLIVSGKGKLVILDPDDLGVIKEFSGLGVSQLLYSKATPDGKYILCPAVWESKIVIIDISTGHIVKSLNVGVDPIHIQIHPEGHLAYISHGRSLFVTKINLKDFSIVGKIPTKGGPNGLAIVSFPQKNNILIFGSCLPLSGPSSTEGREIRLGYQYWMEQVNASGGILIGDKAWKVELIFKDTQSRSNATGDKEFIQKLTQELIEEGVQFMFGSYPTPPNQHMAEYLQGKGIPLVTATGAGEKMYDKGFKHLFGLMSPARVYLSGTIQYLLSNPQIKDKPKSICFLSCDDFAALEDAKATAEFAKKNGIKLLTPPPTPGIKIDPSGVVIYKHLQQDFKNELNAIIALAPDLFFNTGHLAESLLLVEQISELNFSPKGLAFSVGPTVPRFRVQLGNKANALFGSAQWNQYIKLVGHDQFITPEKFARKFFDRFSMPASYFSAGGVVCGLFFEKAFYEARSIDPKYLIPSLRKVKMNTFFAGIELDHRGLNNNKPIITVQIQRDSSGKLIETPIYPPELVGDQPIIWPFPGWE